MPTAEDIIMTLPPGSMIFDEGLVMEAASPEVIFLIREESETIRSLIPLIQFRAGFIDYKGVMLLPILMNIQGSIFESWYNWFEVDVPPGRLCQLLASQQRIFLTFYGASGKERNIRTSNSLCDFFTSVIKMMQTKAPWSMREYDIAKAYLCERFRTPSELWSALT